MLNRVEEVSLHRKKTAINGFKKSLSNLLLYKFKLFFFFYCENLTFRSLNKQIKDKNEHKDKLTEDLKRDGERQRELEQLIQVLYLN